MAGKGEGKQGRDQPPRLPRRRRDQRRRARRRRGRAAPDRRRGRARRRPRRAPAAADAPARLLPADRHRPDRRAGPRHREDLQDRRQAGRRCRRPAQLARRPGRQGRARRRRRGECYDCVIVGAGASGLAAAKFYQDRFGPDKKILLLDPLPDFGGHSHRNEFHVPERRGRRRRPDDPAQRRDGQPRQHRRLEPARRQPARHPRLLRAAGARHARLLRRRRRQLPEQHGARDPRVLRAAPDAAVPGRRTGAPTRWPRTASTRPSPNTPAGWTAFVEPAAVLAGGQGRDRADPDRHDDRLDRRQARAA